MKLRLLISLLILIFILPIKTNAASIILQNPDIEILDDTYVSKLSPNSNYGSSTNLAVFGDKTTEGAFVFYSYLKFNISSIPSKQIIEDAKLYLYKIYAYPFGPPYNTSIYHVYNNSWAEEKITFNNQPCGTDFDNSENCNLVAESTNIEDRTIGIRLNWTVTNMIRQAYEDNKSLISMALRVSFVSPLQVGGSNYYSKEYNIESFRPYLVVNYSTDTDNDGLVDDKDLCPNLFGQTIEFPQGCPSYESFYINSTQIREDLNKEIQERKSVDEQLTIMINNIKMSINLLQQVLDDFINKVTNYLFFLPHGLRQQMVCGAMLQTNVTSVDSLGLHCEINEENACICKSSL